MGVYLACEKGVNTDNRSSLVWSLNEVYLACLMGVYLACWKGVNIDNRCLLVCSLKDAFLAR